jgi:hypothetical protein
MKIIKFQLTIALEVYKHYKIIWGGLNVTKTKQPTFFLTSKMWHKLMSNSNVNVRVFSPLPCYHHSFS